MDCLIDKCIPYISWAPIHPSNTLICTSLLPKTLSSVISNGLAHSYKLWLPIAALFMPGRMMGENTGQIVAASPLKASKLAQHAKLSLESTLKPFMPYFIL